MPTSTIKIPSVSGGVSTQPAHMRLANQSETGTNAIFRVFNGMSARPGSRYVSMISGLVAGATRSHAIHRDDTEKYVVVYQRITTAVFKVLTSAGTDCPLFIGGDSQAYFDSNSAGAADYRLVTIADYTLIDNSLVPMGADTSPAYTVAGDARDFEVLVSQSPVIGSYWRTRTGSLSYPAGFFQYLPGANGYATIRFNQISAVAFGTPALMQAVTANPQGFSMFFAVGASAQTGATWVVATRTLTKVGAFTNVSAGDWVNITAKTVGAGVFTAGYYRIESKTSNDVVILTAATPNTVDATFDLDGVGKVANVAIDLSAVTLADMHDVAKAYEKSIRDALGGLEAAVQWIRDTASGYFVVTHPYAGTSAFFPATAPTRTLPTALYPPHTTTVLDVTNGANDPFYGGGAFTGTAGTGAAGPTTGPVLDRWVRKPAPNQAEALLDPATMPQQMVRLNPAGTYTGGYAQFTEDLRPFAWWRLGEAAGTVAGDEMEANNGTYVNTPDLAQTGALNGDTNTAVTFKSASSEYCDVGALLGWGPGLSRPFTVECWIKTTAATQSAVFCAGSTTSTGYIRIFVSHDGLGNNSGFIYAELHDNAGHTLAIVSNAATTVNNGNFRHLAITFSPASQTASIFLDGVAVTSTTTPTGTCTSFQEFRDGECAIAARLIISSATAFYLNGTVDELALYQGSFSAEMALARYNQGNLSTFSHNPIFAIFPTQWVPRLSGDAVTNPVPKAIHDGRTLADMAFFRNRLAFGANERVFTSQDGDFFNLFLEDAENITDSDPVEKPLSTRQVTIIDFLASVGKSLVITTKAGRQFELGTGTNETFTPTTAKLRQSTSKQTVNGVRPGVIDTLCYLAGKSGDYTTMFEYRTEEESVAGNAQEPGSHVEGYIGTIQSVTTCPNECMVLMLGIDSTIYCYRFFFAQNGSKDQSAWSKWTFNEAHVIRDFCTIGTDLFLVCSTSSTFTLERVALAKVAPETNFQYVVNLDRTFSGLAGTNVVADTTWTLPFTDNTINRVVTAAGVIYSASSSGGVVTVTGANLQGTTVLIGRLVSGSVELSQPFQRDQNGTADLNTEVDNKETCLAYNGSGSFTVRSIATGSSDRTDALPIPSGSLTITGVFKTNMVGRAGNNRLVIEWSDPRPVNVSAVEMAVDVTRRS